MMKLLQRILMQKLTGVYAGTSSKKEMIEMKNRYHRKGLRMRSVSI